jgi:hypothetical protein
MKVHTYNSSYSEDGGMKIGRLGTSGSRRTYLENTQYINGLREWFRYSAYLARVQIPIMPKKKKKEKKMKERGLSLQRKTV